MRGRFIRIRVPPLQFKLRALGVYQAFKGSGSLPAEERPPSRDLLG
jgi:hypothetical protein